MATVSDNTKGNPYHDEEGKFTSEGGGGTKTEDANAPKFLNIKLKEGADLEGLKQEIANKPKLKLKADINLDDMKRDLEEYKSISTIPFLGSSQDIVNNIDKFITAPFVNELDKFYQYGSSQPYEYSPFKFSNGKSGLKINMFVQIMSKFRYNAKYCKTIDREEFNGIVNMINTQGSGSFGQYYDGWRGGREHTPSRIKRNLDLGCGYVVGYRGLSFGGLSFGGYDWRDRLTDALNSYIGYHTDSPIYGSQGCYGTVNYVALSQQYAHQYDGYQGHVMKHIINLKQANIMYADEVEQIRDELKNNRDVLLPKLEEAFSKHVDSEKAKQLALGFMESIQYDLGFTCVLLGGDCLLAGIGNGNQLDILNWGVARILKDW